MFVDEARLAGLIRHPNVVGVSDVGEDEDGPYLIMDYVEGLSLSRTIRELGGRQPIPMQVAVRICLDAAMGLHAAHEVRSEEGTLLHLIHRDVSPQNVLIGFDGTVRVTDFGIAKALGNVSQTNTGVLKGNMGYLSPEQLQFQEADRRSDLFSLGVTLYELLSGARLYPNKDGFDGTRRILSEPPPDIGEVRSDVPPALVELLFEMLSKQREARPSTAVEIVSRLEGILAPLIAEEGSVTVADYMERHFAEHRERHRAFLSEHLRRIDGGANRELRSVPLVPSEESVTKALDARAPQPRSAWAAAAVAAIALAALVSWELHVRGTGVAGAAVDHPAGHPAVQQVAARQIPAPVPQPALRAGREPKAVVPAEAVTSPNVVAPAATPSRANGRKRATAHHVRSVGRKDDRRRPIVEKAGGGGASLTVPLFTQWR